MIRVGPYSFAEVTYDEPSDVLYATRAEEPTASRVRTPEDHICRLDARERLIGISFMEAGEQLRREGGVYVTLPSGVKERAQGAEMAMKSPVG